MGLLTATRPWSWTASAVPVLVTAKLEGKLLTLDAAQLLGMGILTQCGANLVNSYFDYVKKIDTREAAGDTSIVDGHISPGACLPGAVGCLGLSGLLSVRFLAQVPAFRWAYLLGTGLAVSYTAPPLCLKYRSLGDAVVFAAFGPVLTQACAAALTGAADPLVYGYSVPIGLLTECILWANNARDIQADARAGASTLCATLGFKRSKAVYQAMVGCCYGVSALLAVTRRSPGLLLPLLTLPLARQVCAQFKEGKDEMQEAPDRTAQLHLPFGLMMLLGIVLDEQVFSRWFR